MTRLEDLGRERDEIDEELQRLKARRSALNREVRSLRQGDLHLAHEEIVHARGHRVYVGGHTPEKWYGIGKRQFHYLVAQGLRRDHRFLDIACGSLRLGQFLIPYLDRGCYFGIDGSPALIEAGLREELLFDLAAARAPTFETGYDFRFDFAAPVDWAWAQSLFTHLTVEDIDLCLRNLRAVAGPQTRFHFTFFEGDEAENAHDRSHPNLRWQYPFERLQQIAAVTGWHLDYLGDWGHSADQRMVLARPALG